MKRPDSITRYNRLLCFAAVVANSAAVHAAPPSNINLPIAATTYEECSQANNDTPSHNIRSTYYDLDLRMDHGTNLFAAVSGIAYPYHSSSGSGYYQGFGWHVKIIPDGSPDYYVITSHMSEVAIFPGERVTAGSYIGKSGGDPRLQSIGRGRSDGPHVHFGLHRGDGTKAEVLANSSVSTYIRAIDLGKYPNGLQYGPPGLIKTTDFICQKSKNNGDPINDVGHKYQSFNSTYFSLRGVHRFWSPVFNSHFYTMATGEADHLKCCDQNWVYEGLPWKAYNRRAPGSTPLYRFWSPNRRKHFYTVSLSEKDHLIANDPNWQYEGIAYYVYPKGATVSGSSPVYRFYSEKYLGHFFTGSFAEADHLIQNSTDWTYEGIAFDAE